MTLKDGKELYEKHFLMLELIFCLIMGNRLSFYFSQGTKNLKNSVLIILGLSLALSMVSGISLYIDAYQNNLVNESFGQILDFNIEYYEEYYSENVSENIIDYFKDYDSSVISLVENSEKLDIESHFLYFILNSHQLTFYKNYSELYGQPFNGYEIVEGNYVKVALFDENFYTSKRFNQYFSIINGTLPKSEEEILIPIDLAYRMNLTLGETTNLDMKHSWSSETYNSSMSLSDVKVVGIYAAKLRNYQFSYNWLNHDYTYYRENNTVIDYDEIGDWSDEFVFCYYNFSQPKDFHPVEEFIYDFNRYMAYNHSGDFEYFSFEINAGLGFCYNRDNIDFNHLNSFSRAISQETQIIGRQIENKGGVWFQDFLSQHLSELYLFSNLLRILLQILNVPILIFAIFIGSFAIKTNAKSRLDEFLLLRSKGAPNSLLRNQFFIEAFFNGIASSTIALFAGFGTFYGFRSLLDQIFLSYDSTVVLSPSISWGTVILTYVFGIGITFLASFSSIAYVGKLPTHKLLGVLGSDSMDVEYDEKSLFGVVEGKKVSIEETPFYEKSPDLQNSAEIAKESSSKNFFSKLKEKNMIRKRKKHALYENALQIKEKKNPKLSIALIIISLFPFIIYLLFFLGSLPSVPDIFISISGLIMRFFGIILIFVILSPVLFVVGIIRILVVEKPSRFARISQFLSSLFLKGKSYLCGIEMVKRKQYKTVIFLVGIFTSLLVFTNVFLNSFSRYDVIIDNMLVGSDVKVQFDINNMTITNTYDIELLESQLKSYKTTDNKTLINQVMTYYSEMNFIEDDYFNERSYIDIEKYLDIIQEDNKKLPTGDLVSEIEDLIEYNKNSSITGPGVIVNSQFLTINNLKIGDSYRFTHTFYNSSLMDLQNETINVKIIVVTDVLPGFYLLSDQWARSYQEKMIVDISTVNQDKDLLHGIEIYQMIDIDPDIDDDPTVLTGMLNTASSGYVEYTGIEFYDQNWNDLNYKMDLSEQGFYGIIYLEFVVIGVLMAFGLAILILSFQRENKYFNGVLLARGFGRVGLLKLILSQIYIIFLIGITTGLLSGIITSFSFIKIATTMEYGSGIISFPLYANILEIVEILGIIVLSSFVIYLVSYYFEARKNITEYFHKF